jgi:uncharacterized membrane protein YidH (DUF202 family)
VSGFDADSRDPGLAAERTDLAWSRSTLSLLACGAVILRGIGRPPLTGGNAAVGASVLILGTITTLLGAWQIRHARQQGVRRSSTADLLPIVVGVAVVGIVAFVVSAISPS